tara:strand:+ start:962 stop:1165 length:204 start_codon:yes stop_codon:yes gene_type:complete
MSLDLLEQLILPLFDLFGVAVELSRRPGHRFPAIDRGRENAEDLSRITPFSFHGQSTPFRVFARILE